MHILIRTIVVALAALAGVTTALAQEQLAVRLNGIGARECSFWLSNTARKSEGTVWIYGFWTGLNYVAVASDQRQLQVPEKLMLEQVEAQCRLDPAQALATAAWNAYIALQQAGR